jgi:hypothetical protein
LGHQELERRGCRDITRVQAGGADWHEIVARGTDESSAEATAILQLIRFTPTSYVRALGVAKKAAGEAQFPRFRRIASAVEPR